MNARIEAIQKHTADMLAVESHILEDVERQQQDKNVKTNARENKVIMDIERTLTRHVTALESISRQYGEGGEGIEQLWKKAVTEVMGTVAGLYDKVREHTVSRMLRDDYTALSLAAMSYTAYHAFGLAIKEDRISALAQRHLEDLTPLLVELSKVLPHVVVAEVAEENDDFVVDTTCGALAEANTQRAWETEVTNVA
jgi:hypothetical protein